MTGIRTRQHPSTRPSIIDEVGAWMLASPGRGFTASLLAAIVLGWLATVFGGFASRSGGVVAPVLFGPTAVMALVATGLALWLLGLMAVRAWRSKNEG